MLSKLIYLSCCSYLAAFKRGFDYADVIITTAIILQNEVALKPFFFFKITLFLSVGAIIKQQIKDIELTLWGCLVGSVS